jgi:hypothetical protein
VEKLLFILKLDTMFSIMTGENELLYIYTYSNQIDDLMVYGV